MTDEIDKHQIENDEWLDVLAKGHDSAHVGKHPDALQLKKILISREHKELQNVDVQHDWERLQFSMRRIAHQERMQQFKQFASWAAVASVVFGIGFVLLINHDAGPASMPTQVAAIEPPPTVSVTPQGVENSSALKQDEIKKAPTLTLRAKPPTILAEAEPKLLGSAEPEEAEWKDEPKVLAMAPPPEPETAMAEEEPKVTAMAPETLEPGSSAVPTVYVVSSERPQEDADALKLALQIYGVKVDEKIDQHEIDLGFTLPEARHDRIEEEMTRLKLVIPSNLAVHVIFKLKSPEQ